jgi:hypothetical protein
MDPEDATSASIFTLRRPRPMPTLLFCLLNLTLSLIAAYRALEYTAVGAAATLPMMVAGLVALVTPWVLAYALHLFLSGGALLSTVLAIGGTILTVCLAMVTSSLVSLALGLPIVAVAGLWLLLLVAYAVAAFVLSSAVIISKAIRACYRFVQESFEGTTVAQRVQNARTIRLARRSSSVGVACLRGAGLGRLS